MAYGDGNNESKSPDEAIRDAMEIMAIDQAKRGNNGRRGLVIRHLDDLPYAEAMGCGPSAMTEGDTRARLNFIEAHLDEGAVPDERGKPVGAFRDANTGEYIPGGWELVPMPDDLRDDAAYLAKAVARCRDVLDTEGLEAVSQRMKGIETLISKMRQQADPNRRSGQETLEGARLGGKTRDAWNRRQYQPELEKKMARNPRLSVTEARRQVASEFGRSLKTVQTHTNDPRKK